MTTFYAQIALLLPSCLFLLFPQPVLHEALALLRVQAEQERG